MIKEHQAELIQNPEEFVGWRASMVGNPCETFLGHMRLGHEYKPIQGRVKHMLEDGNLHEHDIVKRCEESGYKVLHSYRDRQLTLKIQLRDNLVISGHSDGILWCGSRPFELDRVDPHFVQGCKYYLLEITAPNHFAFARAVQHGLFVQNFQKYIQIQLYLMSDKVKEYTKGDCVCVVKNKNTTALYEEGISFHPELIDQLVERLDRVEALAVHNEVSSFRCNDERQFWCRYNKLCYDNVVPTSVAVSGILNGRSLKEAEELSGIISMWKRGKDLSSEGKELVEESRMELLRIVEEYGAKGLTFDDVKAVMIDSTSRNTDYDTLRAKAPDLYDEVVSVTPKRYIRVM